MQIILIQDVPHLGSLGDEVHVKDGFARNFLLPRGMAIMAGSKKSREIEHHRKRLEQLRAQAIEKAQAESEKVAALELTVQAKAGANGKLFGSVTNRDIQAVLAEQGYELDRRSIQLTVPIKSVGHFTATVKLHTDVKVEVGIQVEPLFEAQPTVGEDGELIEGAAPAPEGVEGAEGAEAAEGTEAPPEGAEGAAATPAEGDVAAAPEAPAAAAAPEAPAPDSEPEPPKADPEN